MTNPQLNSKKPFESKKRSPKKWEDSAKECENARKQVNLLIKVIEDSRRQKVVLLQELGRKQGASLPSDEDLQDIQPVTNVETVIHNNLVLYRSIPQFQEKDLQLLRAVRDLSAQMETEERIYRERMEQKQSEAVREAHVAIQALEKLEGTERTHQVTTEAYIKERNVLKAILERYERGASPLPTTHI